MQSVLPKLVGAVVKWSRRGRIVPPTSTLEFYAGTKASRTCPFTGERRASTGFYSTPATLWRDRRRCCGRELRSEASRHCTRATLEARRQAGDRRGGMAPKHRNTKRRKRRKREPFVMRRWVKVTGESSRKVALWTMAVDVVEGTA